MKKKLFLLLKEERKSDFYDFSFFDHFFFFVFSLVEKEKIGFWEMS